MEPAECIVACQEAIQGNHTRAFGAPGSIGEAQGSGERIAIAPWDAWCNSPEIVGLVHRRSYGRRRRRGRCKDTGSRILEDIACRVIGEHRSHGLIEGCAENAQPILTVILVRSADQDQGAADRKSTRLNSSHSQISYAVFCLKKKKRLNSS